MQLLGIENSRIIYLTQVHRPSGQLYLPDVMEKLVKRYSFVKKPDLDQSTMPYVFSVGKFRSAQITEFSIYNDGVIISSASDTDLLDAFLEDVFEWMSKEFDLVSLNNNPPEKFYESTIIVKAEVDLGLAVRPQNDLAIALDEALKSAKIIAPAKLSGFLVDFDPVDFLGKRKPFRLVVERRTGTSFAENRFFSQAPFRTKDHIKVLRNIEDMALKP